jgi:hypothetical protein
MQHGFCCLVVMSKNQIPYLINLFRQNGQVSVCFSLSKMHNSLIEAPLSITVVNTLTQLYWK